MKIAAACAALGLDPLEAAVSKEAVRSAYAAAVMANHPDQGGDGTLIATLKVARDLLMSHSEIAPCTLCRGVGKTRGRFGAQTCTACGGSGETK